MRCSAVQAIRDRDTFERLAMNNSGCGILLATVLKEPLWALASLAYVEHFVNVSKFNFVQVFFISIRGIERSLGFISDLLLIQHQLRP